MCSTFRIRLYTILSEYTLQLVLMKKIVLSIIIPAYNEEKRIATTLLEIESYLHNLNTPYEIIVVNDGSTDTTSKVVKQIQAKHETILLIDNLNNRGKGYAVHCGMHSANGDYRLYMDADNSISIHHIDNFIEHIQQGADIAIASINHPDAKAIDHNHPYRRVAGLISKYIIKNISTPNIYDTQRGFKLFTKDAAESIFPLQTIWRFGFDIELITIANIKGYKIIELPVTWDNPTGSTVTFGSYFYTLLELGKITRNRLSKKYGK